MSDLLSMINLTVGIGGLMLTSMGLLVAVIYRPIDRATRRYSICFFTLLVVYTGSIVFEQLTDYMPNPALTMRLGILLESLSSSILMPVLTTYLLYLSGESWQRNRLFILSTALWLVYFVLLVYTQFSTDIYTIDAAGVYHRGPLYPLLLVPPALILALNLFGVWRRREWLTPRQRTALLVYLLVPLVCMVIQMRFYGLLTIAFGTVLAAMVMFVFLLSDQQELFIRQTEENARKEFDIRILQMRPHFIYNAMTSIYYITEENPEKGLKVIRDFTIYLRKVFNSVTRREPIPFEEELEHTRAYLSVEQARFEDKLVVTFDTPHMDFRLPPLTLQPIVENAVKHGMDPEIDRMNIVVRTRKVDGGSVIVVENDGANFTLPADIEEGVGLSNTRVRVEQMCSGTFKIEPRDGGGAVVTLFLPG